MIRSLYARFEELIHEVAKFGVVGILAFVITIGLTNLLNSGFKTSWVAATAIATVIATAFAFIGNRNWAFRHRKGKGLGREGMLFFFFNGIGLLIQTGAVALNQHSLGHHDKLSNNVALIFGIGVATLFRLYSYRRWVFLATPAEPPATEQLEPEISRTSDLSAARSATRSAAAATCAFTRFRHVRRFRRFRGSATSAASAASAVPPLPPLPPRPPREPGLRRDLLITMVPRVTPGAIKASQDGEF